MPQTQAKPEIQPLRPSAPFSGARKRQIVPVIPAKPAPAPALIAHVRRPMDPESSRLCAVLRAAGIRFRVLGLSSASAAPYLSTVGGREIGAARDIQRLLAAGTLTHAIHDALHV